MKTIAAGLILGLALTTAALANGYEIYPRPVCWSDDSRHVAVAYPDSFDGYVYSGALALFTAYGHEVWASEDGGWSAPAFLPGWDNGSGLLASVHDGELMLLEFDGRDAPVQTVLESGNVLDCSAYLDAEGAEWIVFSKGQRFGVTSLIRINPDGNNREELLGEGDSAAKTMPVAAPDGSMICYARQPGDQDLSGYERLWFIGMPGREQAKLADEQLREWDYHESNPVFVNPHTIIFQRGGWGDWHLYRWDMETWTELIETTDGQQPSVSSDGEWLAYARRAYPDKEQQEYDWDVQPQVWLRNRLTGVEYQASDAHNGAQWPRIAPGGRHLAWLEADELGVYRLRTLRTTLLVN